MRLRSKREREPIARCGCHLYAMCARLKERDLEDPASSLPVFGEGGRAKRGRVGITGTAVPWMKPHPDPPRRRGGRGPRSQSRLPDLLHDFALLATHKGGE